MVVGEFVDLIPQDEQWHTFLVGGQPIEVMYVGEFPWENEGEDDGNDESA